MGLKISTQGPGTIGNLVEFHHPYYLLNYLTRTLYIHHLVSKQRRRMLVGGYDLDMSYITDRLLAMSFPAEHMRAMYRNPLWQVKSVLDMKHLGHYKVYNLCAEESYDPSHFHGCVEIFPFDDHHVPSLPMIKLFCESVHSWLSLDPQNIAVIHCMAGKGRTGLMVCAYLIYCGMSAEEALQLYAQRRTTNNEGVSIASQLRYVEYWSKILTFPRGVGNGPPDVNLPQPCSRELRRIRLYDTVNTDSVFFVISEVQEIPGQLYRPYVEVCRNGCRQIKKGYQRTNSQCYYLSFINNDEDSKETSDVPHVVVQMDTENPVIYQKTCLDYCFDKPLQVTGDVRVVFYQKMIGGRLFYACFNTAFITNSVLQFSIRDLDKVGYKGKSVCGSAFCVELLFGPANARCSLSPPMNNDDDDVSKDFL
ncbi:PREDICTED: phosphatidylinositol 3,4,5-trisphosphate 3-phosphatase and protein-tyrosine-phosphatase PTEN1 [Nelumbo nucifera]|uniref:Phosphatidylinositol 3,4,5-trisphosphate 3-phosphatase and protein-tyrosine-phosphatase PTEN1 n=1 Tax=Nelumbo nucifera TaxID=4432 RepID=A0A1U7ZWQ2_NELNU|nr:PREDICTED: phosphatidylinositol 3,4,5-trisphosphate 3-phosphatase and protein-tyrosine-phosphatase PTEN1 [Nelumbo nucifera]